MIYRYKGKGVHPIKCELTVRGNVVMVSELDDNTGTSITNVAEDLASQVCEEFGIRYKKLVWIEHYPGKYELFEESFDLVEFEIIGGKLHNPKWQSITQQYAYELMGR